MAHAISITEEAADQLRALPARDQRVVESGILARLIHDPTTPTRAVKRLRPNPFAEYELRLGDFRILYNVDVSKTEVIILLVGRKAGNTLIVGGREFHDHESDPTE